VVTQRFETENLNNGSSIGSYPKIKISDVQKASQESFNKAMVTAVSFSTSFEALLLITLASLCRTTGREEGGFDMRDILTKMEAIASTSGNLQYLPPPSFGETIQLLNHLGEVSLNTLGRVPSPSFRNKPYTLPIVLQKNLVEISTSKSNGRGNAWPMTSLVIDELTLMKGLKTTPHKQLAEKNLPSLF
jgi:hypothetical protein